MAEGEGFSGSGLLAGMFLDAGNNRVQLQLSKEGVSWRTENAAKPPISIPLGQLINATPCDCTTYKQSKHVSCYHCKPKNYVDKYFPELPLYARSMRIHYAVPSGRHSWKLKSQIFSPIEQVKLKEWLDTISSLLFETNHPNRLLIFINPCGGKKKGVKIYEKKVAPIFHLARIECHVIVTVRANQANEMIQELNIHAYDGIVCVGGDGMFSEIMNGILLRSQRDKGININDIYSKLIVPRIPLGIIPAGSTNGAVQCITGSTDPITASLLIIMGQSTSVDVCSVYSSGSFLQFAVTFLAYGYFGDLMRDSEKLRFLGPNRYLFSGFKKFFCRKLYEGELQLQVKVPCDRSLWEHERCCVGCDVCLKASQSSGDSESNNQKLRWLSVQGRFIAVNSAILKCACYLTPKGLSPSQHLGNGSCDVIIVSACSRFNYLRYLFRTTYHNKNPFDLNFVQVYRVQEFSFSPYVREDKTPATGCGGVQENLQQLRSSVWNCDGEIISEPAISAKMHCQLINVFGQGFEDREVSSVLSRCFRFCKS